MSETLRILSIKLINIPIISYIYLFLWWNIFIWEMQHLYSELFYFFEVTCYHLTQFGHLNVFFSSPEESISGSQLFFSGKQLIVWDRSQRTLPLTLQLWNSKMLWGMYAAEASFRQQLPEKAS